MGRYGGVVAVCSGCDIRLRHRQSGRRASWSCRTRQPVRATTQNGAKVARSSMLSVALGYRDVAAASDWLCTAFGFQRHFVATSETGVVHFAQLTFGSAMLMLVSADTALNRYMKQPDEIGGAETRSC